MPYTRPTLAEIVDRDAAEAASRLGLPELPRRSVESVLVRVQSGGVYLLYGYIAWASRQFLPHLCDADQLPEFGYLWSKPRKAAAFASGTATIAGTDGAVIPAGTEMQRADAVGYLTTADATIVSGTADLNLAAQLAGVGGNASSGVSLSLVSPIAGVQSSATVVSISEGLDEEDEEDWRARIVERIQNTPHGGNTADFEAWAKEVPGVTRAWAYKGYFPEESKRVGVAFVCDDTEGGPIPTEDKVAEVLAYLDEVCSAVAHPVPFAPTPVTLDFTISLTPDTVATRAAVEAELRDLVLREGKPDTTIPLSHVREVVSIAPGEYDFIMTVPSADIVIAKGEFPIFGAITWE